MAEHKQFEVRVYAVTGHRYTVQATDAEAAAYGARDAFQRDWQHEGREMWWTENFDSFTVEEIGDDGLTVDGDPIDYVEKGAGADEELVRYQPMHNPTSACRFIELIARMVKDGEHDSEGNEFEMTNDDAVDTVHELITAARKLTGGEA